MADETPKGYLRLNHFHGLRLESEDFETGEKLWRVQCKWGALTRGADAVAVRLQTNRHSPTRG